MFPLRVTGVRPNLGAHSALRAPPLFLVFSWCVLARRARGLVKRRANALGKLESIIVRPKVHEEQARLFGEHVAVQSRDFDPVRAQRLDDWIDF